MNEIETIPPGPVLEGQIEGKRNYKGEIWEFIETMRKARNRAYKPMRRWMTRERIGSDYSYVPRPVVGSPPDTEGRRALINAARRELDKWERRL